MTQLVIARTEVIPIPTVTLSDEQFLLGRQDGTPATIAGVLRIPRIDQGTVPAVVLVHGSGGLGSNSAYWQEQLNAVGIATFALDVFTGRGILNTIDDQEQLGRLSSIVDAYCALDVLASRPWIDPNRIALMGFSRGGQVTLYASVVRFQQLHARKDRKFAAYIPFYPSCVISFIDDDVVSKSPIRIFHGAADDWVPISPVRAYVARLKQMGADVELIAYEGALHSFDSPILPDRFLYPNAVTARNRRMKEISAGRLVDAATGQAFSWNDPSVARGAHVGYNAAAATAATASVIEFLRSVFKLTVAA